MKLRRLVPVIMGGFALGAAARASDTPLLVPDFGKIADVTGAQMSPDPKLHYRIVFGITRAATKAGDINPSLDRVARFVNWRVTASPGITWRSWRSFPAQRP